MAPSSSASFAIVFLPRPLPSALSAIIFLPRPRPVPQDPTFLLSPLRPPPSQAPRRPHHRRGLRAAVFFPGLLLPPVVVLPSQMLLTGRSKYQLGSAAFRPRRPARCIGIACTTGLLII
jgi:hypothetical protein